MFEKNVANKWREKTQSWSELPEMARKLIENVFWNFGTKFYPWRFPKSPVCTSSPDTQAHSFECQIVKENIKIEGKLEDIYTPKAKKEISKTLQQIVKFREIYMDK